MRGWHFILVLLSTVAVIAYIAYAILVAVSTELLKTMRKEEVEAVLGHEVSHVANGDMVTLALIQGVVNIFVFFLTQSSSMW
jgi:Zn-dependent protease with chaperone function